MSTKLALAAAALVAVLAGPAFAGDQDLATLLRDSGRYIPNANMPEWNARNMPAHAYASALAPAVGGAIAPNDFQLQGR